LTSLRKKTEYARYKVVVVDNGSSDNSASLVKENFPWVDVVALDKNYGFSVGNNKGIAYALEKFNPEYVLLLNNDTEVAQEDWLRKMTAVAESEKAIGIVGCKLIYPDGRTQYIGTKLAVTGLSWLKPRDHPDLPETYMVDAVLGACFLTKRSVIDKIGGLDTGFSPFSDEESDFCMRAKKAGYKICMVSTVKVVHLGGTSIGKINSEYVRLILRRNAIRFMLLNFPASWLAKRVPYEARIFVRCFMTRNKTAKRRIPLKLRDSKDMVIEVKTNVRGWLYNLKNLREIAAKRKNRIMKLPLIRQK
jgi:GT2 family glycosyltransferase